MAGREDDGERLRVDRWLWVVRVFKTRSLAARAVGLGQVEVNGQRVKAGRQLKVGDLVRVKKSGQAEQVLCVRAFAGARLSFAAAQALYEETPESVAERARFGEQKRLDALSAPKRELAGAPSTRDRRQTRALKEAHFFSDSEGER